MAGSRGAGRWIERVLILLSLLTGAESVWGQQAEVSGFIRDQSGAAISKANVSIQNIATNLQQGTTTNDAGVYTLPQLQPGIYRLTVDATGFEKQVLEDIKLETAGKVSRNLTLKVGTTSESVTVSSSGINVNTVDASVSTVVDRQFVENIPLNGRSFQSLLTMVPGTAVVAAGSYAQDGGSITVNGQRTEANYFTVDGVSANTGTTPYRAVGGGVGFSGSAPGNTALGTTQSLVSVDALQEFRAITSTYSAEYGRTPGGQFSFTTRSGTNDWHGSLFNYFRNDVLDANNWFNNASRQPKAAMRQNNFGGTLGGPLSIPGVYDGKDKTFFFFSYEGLRLRTPQTAYNRVVPNVAIRKEAPAGIQGFLNSFPIPNGAEIGGSLALFSGSYSNPSTLDTSSIRIDHSFTDSFKIFGRYSDAPSESGSRGGSRLSAVTSTGGTVRTGTVGVTNLLTPHISNEFRFNYTSNNRSLSYKLDDFGGATPWDLNAIPGVGTTGWIWSGFIYGGGDVRTTMTPQTIDQQQINFTDGLTASVGRHTFKFGVDYRRLATPLNLPDYQTTLVLYSEEEIRQNRSDILVTRYAGPFKPVFMNFSSFAQDEWKITPRLNLSLGVRWDINPAPKDAYGSDPYTVDQVTNLATAKLMPRGTDLWRTTYKNFAPRIGAAYRLRELPGWETILRGGYGLFYDMGNNESARGYGAVGTSTSMYFYGAAFPLTEGQLASIPEPNVNPPYVGGGYAGVESYDSNLKLPYVHQWNFAVEQMLGSAQSLTVSYVGSAGRRLLVNRTYYPYLMGNMNFAPATGRGNGTALTVTRNGATSDYHALQAQFQRRLSRGLQAQLSYTWSHAIDEASTNFSIAKLLRGSADFDIRHNFQAAVTYDIPGSYENRFLSALLKRWSLDSRISARSSLPVNISNTTGIDTAVGLNMEYQPNLVSGQPIYLYDSNYPGGRRINRAAFATTPPGVQGNLGRNVIRGFSANQTDIALRREFRLTERFNLQFRGEAFNVFNQANFGAITGSLTNNQFGLATGTLNNQLAGLNSFYQIGGPRSIQLALKLRF